MGKSQSLPRKHKIGNGLMGWGCNSQLLVTRSIVDRREYKLLVTADEDEAAVGYCSSNNEQIVEVLPMSLAADPFILVT